MRYLTYRACLSLVSLAICSLTFPSRASQNSIFIPMPPNTLQGMLNTVTSKAISQPLISSRFSLRFFFACLTR